MAYNRDIWAIPVYFKEFKVFAFCLGIQEWRRCEPTRCFQNNLNK